MQRHIEWAEVDFDTLAAGLPAVEARPITNRSGRQHPLEGDTLLRWPLRGPFSTRARRDWNDVSIGSGRAASPPIQPADAALALRETLRVNGLPKPESWQAGITELGEWWTLQASWPWPDGRPDSAGGRVRRHVYIEHDVRWAALWIGGTLSREDGATITATHERAALTGPLITGRRPNRALAHVVWRRIEELAQTLISWRKQAVTSGALATWVVEYMDASWGPETGPRLLLRNGVSTRRGPAEMETGSRIVRDDLNQIAWQLGLAALCVADVVERCELTCRILTTVQDLAAYTNGLQDGEDSGDSEDGEGEPKTTTRQVH